MTELELFDYYAGKAMTALLSNPKIINKSCLGNGEFLSSKIDEASEYITGFAFIVADDMMKARKTCSREYFRPDMGTTNYKENFTTDNKLGLKA